MGWGMMNLRTILDSKAFKMIFRFVSNQYVASGLPIPDEAVQFVSDL